MNWQKMNKLIDWLTEWMTDWLIDRQTNGETKDQEGMEKLKNTYNYRGRERKAQKNDSEERETGARKGRDWRKKQGNMIRGNTL